VLDSISIVDTCGAVWLCARSLRRHGRTSSSWQVFFGQALQGIRGKWVASSRRADGDYACLLQAFSEEALAFQDRIAMKSGLEWGKTALPPALWTDPPDISMANARDEAEMVMFPVVEAALKKTGAAPAVCIIADAAIHGADKLVVLDLRSRTQLFDVIAAGCACSAATNSGSDSIQIQSHTLTQSARDDCCRSLPVCQDPAPSCSHAVSPLTEERVHCFPTASLTHP